MKKKLKKLICLLLVVFMLPSLPVKATNTISSEDIANLEIVNNVQINNNGIVYTQLTTNTDDGKYVSEIYDDVIFVYDEFGVLLLSATYSTKNSVSSVYIEDPAGINSRSLIDTYDQWNAWYQTTMVQFKPQFSGNSITSGALSALMVSAFTGAGLFVPATAIGLLCGVIADSIVNGQIVYVKGDYRYNKYCNILRKERVNQYYANGTVKRYGQETYRWLGSVWDYATTDSSCRVLVEKYP